MCIHTCVIHTRTVPRIAGLGVQLTSYTRPASIERGRVVTEPVSELYPPQMCVIHTRTVPCIAGFGVQLTSYTRPASIERGRVITEPISELYPFSTCYSTIIPACPFRKPAMDWKKLIWTIRHGIWKKICCNLSMSFAIKYKTAAAIIRGALHLIITQEKVQHTKNLLFQKHMWNIRLKHDKCLNWVMHAYGMFIKIYVLRTSSNSCRMSILKNKSLPENALKVLCQGVSSKKMLIQKQVWKEQFAYKMRQVNNFVLLLIFMIPGNG